MIYSTQQFSSRKHQWLLVILQWRYIEKLKEWRTFENQVSAVHTSSIIYRPNPGIICSVYPIDQLIFWFIDLESQYHKTHKGKAALIAFMPSFRGKFGQFQFKRGQSLGFQSSKRHEDGLSIQVLDFPRCNIGSQVFHLQEWNMARETKWDTEYCSPAVIDGSNRSG